MHNPPPPEEQPQEPERPYRRERAYDDDDYDDDRDLSRFRRRPADTDLSGGDWVLCVLCSGIACLIGIIRLMQGKPNAGKMIGVSLLFVIFWSVIRFLIEGLMVPQRRF